MKVLNFVAFISTVFCDRFKLFLRNKKKMKGEKKIFLDAWFVYVQMLLQVIFLDFFTMIQYSCLRLSSVNFKEIFLSIGN